VDWITSHGTLLIALFMAAAFGYILWSVLSDSAPMSNGTTRNRGISGERGDEYVSRDAL
jgi:hypothetical protein